MSSQIPDPRGTLILNILRLGMLATASAMVGVLAHAVWRLLAT